MSDHFLRFDDEAAAGSALATANLPTETGPGWAVERLGTLMTEAVRDAAFEIVAMPTDLPGYHVNLRLIEIDLPANLAASEIFPITPYRRFA